MFFLMIGASGVGKTTSLNILTDLIEGVAIHDFDEIGIPENATPAWRAQADSHWLERALQYQAQGVDMLLAGQTPLGELLACPAAVELDGIAACLLDCNDIERRRRLATRTATFGPEHDNWAAWHRRHADDPQFEPHVITDIDASFHWDRWRGWERGDPRWSVFPLDTTTTPPREVASRIADWIEEQRRMHALGVGALSGDWWEPRTPAAASSPEMR